MAKDTLKHGLFYALRIGKGVLRTEMSLSLIIGFLRKTSILLLSYMLGNQIDPNFKLKQLKN